VSSPARNRSPLADLVAVAAAALMVAAPSAAAASYRTCTLTEREQQPTNHVPQYNLSLKQQGTTCATAKKVMNAFHKCRSPKGYVCTRKVLTRWTCTGVRDSRIETTFYAHYTCTWGSRRVKGSYQQNT
jgi:hypothetical protein